MTYHRSVVRVLTFRPTSPPWGEEPLPWAVEIEQDEILATFDIVVRDPAREEAARASLALRIVAK